MAEAMAEATTHVGAGAEAATPRALSLLRGLGTWRARFVAAERDRARVAITPAELCAIRWAFSDGLQHPQFRADGTLAMEVGGRRFARHRRS